MRVPASGAPAPITARNDGGPPQPIDNMACPRPRNEMSCGPDANPLDVMYVEGSPVAKRSWRPRHSRLTEPVPLQHFVAGVAPSRNPTHDPVVCVVPASATYSPPSGPKLSPRGLLRPLMTVVMAAADTSATGRGGVCAGAGATTSSAHPVVSTTIVENARNGLRDIMGINSVCR